MRDLIERLERATGPDRELDALIMASFPDSMPDPRATMVPAYTGSLDAALTLVPDGWLWTVATWLFEAQVGYYSDCAENLDENSMVFEAKAVATPALALCIAALKAREAAK